MKPVKLKGNNLIYFWKKMMSKNKTICPIFLLQLDKSLPNIFLPFSITNNSMFLLGLIVLSTFPSSFIIFFQTSPRSSGGPPREKFVEFGRDNLMKLQSPHHLYHSFVYRISTSRVNFALIESINLLICVWWTRRLPIWFTKPCHWVENFKIC